MKLLKYLFVLKCCLSLSRTSSSIIRPKENTKLVLNGTRAELSCSLKGKSLDELELFWLRMRKDGSPQFVVSISVLSKITRGESIDSRFSITRSSFQSSFNLIINKPQLPDSGTYYCLVPEGYLWGSAIQLSVVTEIQKATSPPTTTRRRYYHSKPKIPKKIKKLSCSWMVWGSLLVVIVLLLISITIVVIYRHRNRRRRCPHHFRKRYA